MFSADELNEVMRMDTPRVKIVAWHLSHLYMCDLNDFDQENFEMFESSNESITAFSENGQAFTAIVEGDVMAMFGVNILWPGCAEAWLVPNKNIGREKFALHRGSLAFFKYFSSKTGTRRIQITVHTLNVPADAWARRCYFQKEGVLRKYGPDGADYFMYARIFQ